MMNIVRILEEIQIHITISLNTWKRHVEGTKDRSSEKQNIRDLFRGK